MGYNGWANWETWNVNLWVVNDESWYWGMLEGIPYTPESAKAFVEYIFPDGTPDMDSGYKLSKVNWQQIADAWNEE